jgi:hypothetical protein
VSSDGNVLFLAFIREGEERIGWEPRIGLHEILANRLGHIHRPPRIIGCRHGYAQGGICGLGAIYERSGNEHARAGCHP